MSEQEEHDKDPQDDKDTAETATAQEPAAEETHQPRHPGRGLSLLALLLALGAYGGGYWLWTQSQQQRSDSEQAQQQLASKLSDVDAAQKMLAGKLDQAGNRLTTLDQGQQDLTKALGDINQRLGRNREAWVLAEAEYLLEMGNRRLQLEQDVTGAIAALSAADQRLASLGDPLLTPVRAKISDELQALRAVPQVDVDGISLALGSLAKSVDTLPIAGAPHPVATPTTPLAVNHGWRAFVASLWADMRSLVVVRRHETGKLPLLTPDQRDLLRQNLRLKLQTARLALLQGDRQVYRDALQEADGWLTQYFDGEAAATKAAHETLARLSATDIAPPLPAIDASLRLLRSSLEQIGGKQKSVAKGGRS